ncbi:hypothetical protein L1987_69741 [Smallanthus sonchifolius]|uniref:Uncharacterized protein n=1 Tax=Smallanthus sonchifolius TaxID=185202 RepID=A0ACB9B7R8_9ASTR|nr:hypothetical protein L1987_69741 [Smallanthus sonchifolius]
METKPLISLIILLQAIINCVNLAIAQKPTPDQQAFRCSKNGNFKSDDLIKERDAAFNVLYKNIQQPIYTGYDSGNGEGIWSYALCPPNIKMEACRECVNNTMPYLKQNCPKQKEGVAWTVLKTMMCMTPATAAELEKGVNSLADKLKDKAVGGDSAKKYESGSITYGPGSRALYGSMQCLPHMAKVQCRQCLSDATTRIHNDCTKS